MPQPTADPQDPGQHPLPPTEPPTEHPLEQPLQPAGGAPTTTAGAPGDLPEPGALTEAEDEAVADLEVALRAEAHELEPYQAVLLASFGGPEGPDEVMPFLRRVTGGRGIPDERLAEVAEHYHAFGGRSPINEQNRALIEALGAELARRGLTLPILFGNRNSEPFLVDTLRDASDEGMTRILAVTTSAYSSYSSCRQYREDFAAAVGELAEEGREVHVDKVRQYWNHPGFSRTNARIVTEGVRQTFERTGVTPHVLFVTHSLPDAMDETSGPGDDEGRLYSRQHLELAGAIAEEAAATLGRPLDHDLTYCSRSGPPQQPWLEPDVNDRLRELADQGVTHVLIAPIGFVSDHMEVVFDLDTEAMDTARGLGLQALRLPTVGTDPEFVSGLADLLVERAAEARGELAARPTWPGQEPRPAVCPRACCPNLRQARPAACGEDA